MATASQKQQVKLGKERLKRGGWCSYVRTTQPGATLKIASIFSRKKPSRKLLQKQACPLPLSHEKTCNNKEHESSEKMFTLIAFRHYENQISSTCMF